MPKKLIERQDNYIPYIKLSERKEVCPTSAYSVLTPGQLNYQFTQLIINYLSGHGKSYTTLNDIIGALECAKLELYRRVAAPYEDTKIKENGDVYP